MIKQILEFFRKEKVESTSVVKDQEVVVTTNSEIGEPVLSVVDLIRRKPKRFRFKTHYSMYSNEYQAIDKVTGETFTVGGCGDFVYGAPWMTKEEAEYAYREVSEMVRNRYRAASDYLKNKERKRVTKLYTSE